MNHLQFRRQFLLTPKGCPQLEDWQKQVIDSHTLYVHKDCALSVVNKGENKYILIGYAINPKEPNAENIDILKQLSEQSTLEQIPEFLYGLTGRFVLIIKTIDRFILYNDACGLKTIYYTTKQNELYAASQPLLLELVISLKKGDSYQQYINSDYILKSREHWIPSGCSLFEDVYLLTPNHYFDSFLTKEVRYYPKKSLQKKAIEEAVTEFSSLLEKTMVAANNRFKLALTVTAGMDSRTVLAACKAIANDLYFYTLLYRDLQKDSNDVIIPSKILSSLGFSHNIIDCNKPTSENFKLIYESNTTIAHFYDWGTIANGMYNCFPQEFVAVKGNCAEIGRCYFYPTGRNVKITSSDYFINLEFGWEKLPFIKEIISNWFEESGNLNLGYDLLDLFYWEHRMGGWQAQSQLEWDIVQEVFTPFNNRELLDIILSVDSKYRSNPNYEFFIRSIQSLWKEVLVEPINPQSFNFKNIKCLIKNELIKLGIFTKLKTLKEKIV